MPMKVTNLYVLTFLNTDDAIEVVHQEACGDLKKAKTRLVEIINEAAKQIECDVVYKVNQIYKSETPNLWCLDNDIYFATIRKCRVH